MIREGGEQLDSAERPQTGAGGIATEDEAFRFLSDVMRGTLTEPGGKAVTIGDRLKACSGLIKLFETHEEESAAGPRRRSGSDRASHRDLRRCWGTCWFTDTRTMTCRAGAAA